LKPFPDGNANPSANHGSTLSLSPCLSALPAGPTPGGVGAAVETHDSVLPDRGLRVHGTVPGVRL